jgi:hypothetical protein
MAHVNDCTCIVLQKRAEIRSRITTIPSAFDKSWLKTWLNCVDESGYCVCTWRNDKRIERRNLFRRQPGVTVVWLNARNSRMVHPKDYCAVVYLNRYVVYCHETGLVPDVACNSKYITRKPYELQLQVSPCKGMIGPIWYRHSWHFSACLWHLFLWRSVRRRRRENVESNRTLLAPGFPLPGVACFWIH